MKPFGEWTGGEKFGAGCGGGCLLIFVVGAILSAAGVKDVADAFRQHPVREVAPANGYATVPPPAPESIAVTAVDLCAAYAANGVAADQTYRGKRVVVTGLVDKVSRDIMDAPYVMLKGGSNELFGVQCSFAQSAESELAQLQPDQKVQIEGECTGQTVMMVGVKDCALR